MNKLYYEFKNMQLVLNTLKKHMCYNRGAQCIAEDGVCVYV